MWILHRTTPWIVRVGFDKYNSREMRHFRFLSSHSADGHENYVGRFVRDVSQKYQRRKKKDTPPYEDVEASKRSREEFVVCANCKAGGAHDGGLPLDTKTGFCVAWCSKGNYCGETPTYSSSPQSVDCRSFRTHGGSRDIVVYEAWRRGLEESRAYGKAARDVLTCIECQSGSTKDGGSVRFRDQFCDQWCSVSPSGFPGGFCGTSGSYRRGGTDCRFMRRFRDAPNDLVSEWVDLLGQQLDVGADDVHLTRVANQFLWCAKCGRGESPCTGLCVLRAEGDGSQSHCVASGFDRQPASNHNLDCRAFQRLFHTIGIHSADDSLVLRAFSGGAPLIPTVREHERHICRDHCSRSGLLFDNIAKNNGPSCYRFCNPKEGHCSNLAETTVDCHEKGDLRKTSLDRNGTTTESVVVVVTAPERVDRLGSYMQMVYGLRVVAAHYGWTPRSGHCEMGQMLDHGRVKVPVLKMFGWRQPCFDVSSVVDCDRLEPSLASSLCAANIPLKLITGNIDAHVPLKSGFYIISQPWRIVHNFEQNGKRGSVFSPEVASMLRGEFLHSPWREREKESCEFCKLQGNLVRIAVHVRRGDIRPHGHYARAFVSDETFLNLIRRVALVLHAANRRARVVVFSEAYGTTNWLKWTNFMTETPGIESFHLRLSSTHGSNDVQGSKSALLRSDRETLRTELPDIHDFVVSDVLVVGGTFSAIAGLLRPPETGATFYLSKNHGYFGYVKGFAPSWWIEFDRKGNIESPCELAILNGSSLRLGCLP